MSSPDIYDALHDRLVSAWSETPIYFENEDFAPGSQDAFVFAEIVGDTLAQDTFGSPQANGWLEAGALYLHVMVPNGTGTRDARRLGRALTQIFREQPIGSLHFDDMSIGAGEPGRDFPNHFALTVTVSFSRRDVTTLP